jgi:hypothetical protein
MKITSLFKSAEWFEVSRAELSTSKRARNNSSSVGFLAISICSLGAATALPAEIIFSDLGPGGSYQSSSGWTIYGTTAPTKTDRASSFVPAGNYTLDSIQAAFTWSFGFNTGDMYLMSDNGGVPGTILESFHFNNLPHFGVSPTALTTGVSTLHPLLSAGVRYWVATSANDDSFLSFNWNNTGYMGVASRDNGGAWGMSPDLTAGAFLVTATPVPEPTGFALAGLAATLAGFWFAQRRVRT